MKYSLSFAIALMSLVLSGCANNASQQHAEVPPPDFESEKSPDLNVNTHFAAGILAERHSEPAAAEAQYQEALKLDKKYQPAMYRLGCLYATQKRFNESLAMWKRYLEATQNSAFAYSNLAYTEELAGFPDRAEADYKAGIIREPNNPPCRINYGLMLARHGRIAEGSLQLQTVLTPAEVHFNIASVYELQQRTEMAKLEYQRALIVDPNFSDARDKLATLGGMAPEDGD